MSLLHTGFVHFSHRKAESFPAPDFKSTKKKAVSMSSYYYKKLLKMSCNGILNYTAGTTN